MAISSYTSLKTAIINWLDRDGLDSVVDDFIDLAEAHFNRTLRLRAQETALSVTISSGVAAVPSDLLELKHAYIDSSGANLLEIVGAQDLYRKYPVRSATALPRLISRDGSNFIFGPYPDSDYTLAGIYYAKWTALSDDNSTNWLLSNAPDLYLYRSLVEAEGYIGNDARIATWAARAQAAQAQVDEQDDMEKYPAGMAPMTRMA